MHELSNNKLGIKIWVDVKLGDDVITANRGSVDFNNKIQDLQSKNKRRSSMENVKQIAGKIDQQQSRQVSQSLAQFPNDEDSSSEEEVKGGQPQLKPKQRQSAIKIPDNKND